MYPELVISVIGLISGFLITRKHPILRETVRSAIKKEKPDEISSDIKADSSPEIKLSVIIPISEDDGTLTVLMNNLADQTRSADEIILVGDSTVDSISNATTVNGVRFVQIPPTPSDWQSMPERTWDCIVGADAADGDLLLFLTTDKRLERDAIQLMLQAALKHPSTVQSTSLPVVVIQPFCDTKNILENVSFFSVLTNSVVNGVGTTWPNNLIDPLGPIKMMPREVYQFIRSHFATSENSTRISTSRLETRKSSSQKGISSHHSLGGQDIHFRPGGGRFHQLMQILTAGTAPRILQTPPCLLTLIILWLVACTSIFIGLIQTALQTDALPVLIYLALYLLALLQLNLASRHVGRFSRSAIFFYPLWLVAFYVIFTISLFQNYVFTKSKSDRKETTL